MEEVRSVRPTPPEAPQLAVALPKAPLQPAGAAESAEQLKFAKEREEGALRALRLFLRAVIQRLQKQFKVRLGDPRPGTEHVSLLQEFNEPVDADEHPDYYQIILRPVCLVDMLQVVPSAQRRASAA
jgi:hypothetical protein